MRRSRLEAFSDGVIAILITIMVLELKVPHDASFAALDELLSDFLAYLLSFVLIGIYWNNHHHMLQMTSRINGKILWANLHLLFWLSLVPLTTTWMGETHLARVPTAMYGVVLLASSIAYYILQSSIIADQGEGGVLKAAVKRDLKGKASMIIYGVAIGLAFVQPAIAAALYVSVAFIWLVPDRRIESKFADLGATDS